MASMRVFNFTVAFQSGARIFKEIKASSLPQAWQLLDAELTGKFVVSKTYHGA